MFCYFCGKEIGNNSEFCPYCGQSVKSGNEQYRNAQQYGANQHNNSIVENEYTPRREKRDDGINNKNVIILVCVTIAALITALIVSISVINKQNSSDDGDNAVAETESIAPSDMPEITLAPDNNLQSNEVFIRTTTYNPNYVYKNMNDIHTSKAASDQDSFRLKEVIQRYNDAWLGLVNNGDMSIYSYLRAGTQAYDYAKKFEQKPVTESYDLLEVHDVRKTDSYYYVWTHEIINEYNYEKNTTKRNEYRWIYKVGIDNSGYYIINYIKDPAYK